MEPFSELSLVQLDPYNRSFVATVLELRGVMGVPDVTQFKSALQTLTDYYMELAAATDRGDNIDENWLDGQDLSQAGAEHAFCFVRFATVTIPDESQRAALNAWRGKAALPSGLLH